MLAGLWSAYLLFGLFFDYHVATHDYYHLPLIAIVAVSMAPLADMLWEQFARVGFAAVDVNGRLSRSSCMRVFSGALAGQVAAGCRRLSTSGRHVERDRRPAGSWSERGGLDPGLRLPLAYWGWQNAIIWPSTGDARVSTGTRRIRSSSRSNSSKLTLGNTYFLVTDFDELAPPA